MTNEEKLSNLIESTTNDLLSSFLPEAINLGAAPETVAALANAISFFSSSHKNLIDEDEVYEMQADLTGQINQLQETVADLEQQLEQMELTAPRKISQTQAIASANGRIKERITARRRGFGVAN